MNIFTLTEKITLTHDVFLLKFTSEKKLPFIPGQFITFLLPEVGGRAYSVAWTNGEEFHFIIKRLEDGKGGSKKICDIAVGEALKAVGPVGKFVLKENNNKKLFIGTGTGFAPLYCMFEALGDNTQNQFVFGVREAKDLFYIDEIAAEKIPTQLFLSREDAEKTSRGYVTDFITPQSIENFDEVYICGSPAMCQDAIEKLKDFGFNEENIFSEEY